MGDRHLFIGNLCNVTQEALRSYCEKYGTIIDLSLNRDKDNNIYHCFAFVTYQLPRSTTQFMLKRPHVINGEQIFVKRALPRLTASIPERLAVTNRLVIVDSIKYDKENLRNYFQKFAHIKNFDYEHGFIDYDDYDDVDRVLLSRPHYIKKKEVSVTKFIPQPKDVVEQSNPVTLDTDIEEEENLKIQFKTLEKEFELYKKLKEKEIDFLKKELEKSQEELSDITQIKLDKLIKNQQLFHNQLLLRLYPDADAIHAQMCEDFLRSTPSKKRKATTNLFEQ